LSPQERWRLAAMKLDARTAGCQRKRASMRPGKYKVDLDTPIAICKPNLEAAVVQRVAGLEAQIALIEANFRPGGTFG